MSLPVLILALKNQGKLVTGMHLYESQGSIFTEQF
jgi:hypothetical protein